MRPALLLVVVPGLALGGCGACEPASSRADAAAADASTSASAAVSATPHPVASAQHAPRPPRVPCRNVGVEGDVHAEATADAGADPLLLQGFAPVDGWVALAAGGRFVAKDPRTARETTFRGPGRVRACVGLAEESWIASGTFESNPGAGDGPGAEEWVITPAGVVRYTAAKVQAVVGPGGASVTVATGEAFAWAPDGATLRADGDAGTREDGWTRLESPRTAHLTAPGAALDVARTSAAQCQALGKTAGDLAATLMAGGADASTIMQQVATRRLARAACAVASLRVAALPASAPSGPMQKAIAEGSADFNSVGQPEARP